MHKMAQLELLNHFGYILYVISTCIQHGSWAQIIGLSKDLISNLLILKIEYVGGWLDYVKIRQTQPQVELEA